MLLGRRARRSERLLLTSLPMLLLASAASGAGASADPARVRQRRDAAVLRPDQQGRAELRRRHRQRDLRADRQRQLEYPRRPCATVRTSATGTSRTSTSSATRPSRPTTPASSTSRRTPRTGNSTNGNIRKIDFTLEHDRYGKFWLGQGSMATDGVYEIDLSGTTVIDYSSVADSASAQIIRFSDPGPRLRREPERHHHRQRLHQLRRSAPGAHPLRHPRVQRLHRRRRLRPQPAERRFRGARGEHLRRLGDLRATPTATSRSRAGSATTGRRTTPATGAARPRRCTRRPGSTPRSPSARRTPTAAAAASGTASSASCATSSPGAPPRRRSTTIPATTSSSTPTRASTARLATLSACRWCRTSTGRTPNFGLPTEPTTTPTTSPATRTGRRSSAARASGSDPGHSKEGRA